MPLDHQEPLGDEIEVMVTRQRARGISQAELWLLSGGPGNSAYHFGLIDNSPVRTPGVPTCAVQMIADFINDPTTPPDPACLQDLRPFDSRGPSEHALLFFGTADMWENEATP